MSLKSLISPMGFLFAAVDEGLRILRYSVCAGSIGHLMVSVKKPVGGEILRQKSTSVPLFSPVSPLSDLFCCIDAAISTHLIFVILRIDPQLWFHPNGLLGSNTPRQKFGRMAGDDDGTASCFSLLGSGGYG